MSSDWAITTGSVSDEIEISIDGTGGLFSRDDARALCEALGAALGLCVCPKSGCAPNPPCAPRQQPCWPRWVDPLPEWPLAPTVTSTGTGTEPPSCKPGSCCS